MSFHIARTPVLALVDLSQPQSKLSSAWMHRHGRDVDYQLSLPLTMNTPEDGEKTVNITFSFELASKMPSDAVLGLDWVHAMAGQYGSQSSPASSSLPGVGSTSVSSENTLTDPSVEPVASQPPGAEGREERILNWFFRRSSVSYLLSVGSTRLDAAVSDHGIESHSMDHRQKRCALLHHILGGLCAARRTGACVAFAQNNKAVDLRRLAYDTLVSIVTTSVGEDGHIRSILSDLGIEKALFLARADIFMRLDMLLVNQSGSAFPDAMKFVDLVDQMCKAELIEQHLLHGIEKGPATNATALKSNLIAHFLSGHCGSIEGEFEGCLHVRNQMPPYTKPPPDIGLGLLHQSVRTMKLKSLRVALDKLDMTYSLSDGPAKLRRLVKQGVRLNSRGKRVAKDLDFDTACCASFAQRTFASNSWPPEQSRETLDKLVSDFHAALSSDALSQSICASCSELIFKSDACVKPLEDVNLAPLTRPDRSDYVRPDRQPWLDPGLPEPAFDLFNGIDADVLVDSRGLISDKNRIDIILCDPCDKALSRDRIPALSLANKMFLGEVPPELKDLTAIEESMISLCRSKCMIVQLREEKAQDASGEESKQSPNSQRGYKGNVIVYPKNVDGVATLLPPSVEDIVAPICVIFIGSHTPSREWIQEHAKPLAVNARRVRRALVWLKEHNPLYRDVTINEDVLQVVDKDPVLPFHVEHMLPDESAQAPTSRYDVAESCDSQTDPPNQPSKTHQVKLDTKPREIAFENVMIADVDGNASTNELRAAAIRHMKEKGKDFIAISHEDSPESDFDNPTLFPKMFPTLYPYGIGGMEDPTREEKVSMIAQVQHLMNLADRRFQTHASFMFIAFNILQRRRVLLESHLRVKRDAFDKVMSIYEGISPDDIEAVTDRVARGDYGSAFNEGERCVLQLLREVEVVTTAVPGSAASRLAMRNEIRGMIHTHGLPSFYLTINPADVYNPVLSFLSGNEFDLDRMVPEDGLGYWKQSMLIAKNPAVTARFFNIFIKAFIKTLLGYRGQDSAQAGALGVVKSYYGCVEAQGRGSLHCHMVVWVEGSMSPDEIRSRLKSEPGGEFQKRLINYLEEAVSTSIPADEEPQRRKSKGINPCATRGPWRRDNETDTDFENRKLKDFAELVRACQTHTHTATCYKYCKPGEKLVCRFGLDEAAILKETVVDPETGALNLRKLDGMVNNFNKTILRAIRCNMDIQFIPSGPEAKAVMYYITDYISKAQLPAHVAYATLEVAVKKLDKVDHSDMPTDIVAKQLLRKCANALLGKQELSAQQVASYVMRLEDHFTSHSFRRLYWTPFETYLDSMLPSPECYRSARESRQERDTVPAAPDSAEEDSFDVDMDGLESDNETNLSEAKPAQRLDKAIGDDFWIGVDKEGRLRPRMTRVADYVFRGPEMKDVSLWDFVAQVDKRYCSNIGECHPQDNGDNVPTALESESDTDTDDVLCAAAIHSIKSRLMSQHCHHDSHLLHVRKPGNRLLPVASGPSLPRRTVDKEKDRWSRLMLMFFKPWRTAEDLRGEYNSWNDACEAFLTGNDCPSRAGVVIDNMQALTECKQARDDHMSNRAPMTRNSRIPADFIMNSTQIESSDEHDVSAGDVEDEVLRSLQHIQDVYSERNLRSLEEAHKARQRVGECQLYNFAAKSVVGSVEEVQGTTHPIEAAWKKAYKTRRDAWKKPQKRKTNPAAIVDPRLKAVAEIRNAADYRPESERSTRAPPTFIGGVSAVERMGSAALPEDDEATVEAVSRKLTLNREQRLALEIIAKQAEGPQNATPLRMYVGGAAGTGKSRVVDAVRMLFQRRKEAHRLKLSAFMGIAARNIQGHTLHSLLSLNSITSKGVSSGVATALRALWDGVDFLIIDEVSMVSCDLLYSVNEALKIATGKTDMGGLNVIFVGDFAQLPPVGETKLFGMIDTKKCSSKLDVQKRLMGQAKWKDVNTVVLLSKLNRQAGKRNVRFGELLGRLRRGCCTREDYELLQSRVVGKHEWTTLDSSWADATVIVYENAKKDALNEEGAAAFAKATNQELHWYYAEDRCQSADLKERRELREYLHQLPSGQTKQLLGRLPLVIGMPVYVGSNFDVSSGVTNGAYGTVKRIRYRVNEYGHRVLISCVVDMADTDGEAMPYLSEKEVPILPESMSIKFKNPYDKSEKVNITRTQLPLAPAFAMTAHKAQGQTLRRVIADIKNTSGIEAPCLTRDVSEESRRLTEKLNHLHYKTVQKYGDAAEQIEATSVLAALRASQSQASDYRVELARNELASAKRRRPASSSETDAEQKGKRPRL